VANVLLVIDPDEGRRTQFVATAAPRLALLDGLRTEQAACGDLAALWARDPRAPVSEDTDAQGVGLVWGDALGADGAAPVDAQRLRTLWADPHAAPVFDGFHAAATYDRHLGLRVGADPLGLFPLYYWQSGDVVLVGASAELFRCHPLFRITLSPVGLAGILLTSHLVDGLTIVEGVRRVGAGALLIWTSGSTASEVPRFRLPVSRRHFDQPFSEHVDILDRLLDEATGRHMYPGAPHTLLLSGGLDSRMLGGYLAHRRVETVALTLGEARDFEMEAAARVARALGFPHRTADVPFDDYPHCADRQARWEHLANGFSTIRLWGLPAILRDLPSRVVAGYATDAIIGGPLVHYSRDRPAAGPSFEAAFAFYNRTGLHPAVVRRLLRHRMFDGAIEQAIDRLRAVYESYSDLDAQRAWCFELCHRQRFQIGAALWRASFGAWPVLPALDRTILQAAGSMPVSTIARRRAQKALVRRRFPALAALPLDRNSYDTRPLERPSGQALSAIVRQQWRRALGRLPVAWRGERRYYYRVYDLNNAGWRAVRREVEPLRERVLEFFDRDALDALLPRADAHVAFHDPIVDSSGAKLLLGFLRWSADHL
jgi:asparagine synthase (glutamine-hydrolysing)